MTRINTMGDILSYTEFILGIAEERGVKGGCKASVYSTDPGLARGPRGPKHNLKKPMGCFNSCQLQ